MTFPSNTLATNISSALGYKTGKRFLEVRCILQQNKTSEQEVKPGKLDSLLRRWDTDIQDSSRQSTNTIVKIRNFLLTSSTEVQRRDCKISSHGGEENLNGQKEGGHPRWWESCKQRCQVKYESAGHREPSWEALGAQSGIYGQIMEGLEGYWKNLGCIRGSWEAVKDVLFIEQILMEPGTMICMEDTVVIPRDSPSPYGAWNLVMETDTEQIQNVKT